MILGVGALMFHLCSPFAFSCGDMFHWFEIDLHCIVQLIFCAIKYPKHTTVKLTLVLPSIF